MTTLPNPHAIPLDPRVTITAARKKFVHSYTYQAPVTSYMGNVSGGGTRGGSFVKTGYCLRITNNEPDLRSYYLSIGIFTDHANKIVRTTIPRHIAHVHPGHTMEVDIELEQKTDFPNAYLIDFVISLGGQTPLAHYTPDYPLALAAEPNGPTEEDELSMFDWLVGLELAFVSFIIGSLLSSHYHWGGWASWGGGIGSFLLGWVVLGNWLGRLLLCGLFSLIWGLLAFGKFGLLEALGVTALAGLLHWGLGARPQHKHYTAHGKGNLPTK